MLRNGLFVPSLIKSIQRGTITIGSSDTAETATITAVNPSNTRLKIMGERIAASAGGARIALTNATTVTADRQTTGGGTTKTVNYEVVEYYPGVIKSIQRGTITLTAPATSNTATITAVNNRAEVAFLGTSYDTDAFEQSMHQANVTLTNSTTLTAQRVTGVGNVIVGYEVIEWF